MPRRIVPSESIAHSHQERLNMRTLAPHTHRKVAKQVKTRGYARSNREPGRARFELDKDGAIIGPRKEKKKNG